VSPRGPVPLGGCVERPKEQDALRKWQDLVVVRLENDRACDGPTSLSMVSFSLQLKSNQVHEIIMCLMSPASIMIDQGTNACCFT
jgi:hypothetical protein